MDWQSNVISEFGKTLGIENVIFNENKLVHLNYEEVGDLYFQIKENYIWFFLVKKIDIHDPYDSMIDLLQKNYYTNGYDFPFKLAFNDDNRELVISTQIIDMDFSVQNINYIVDSIQSILI